jgi:hypothetical protein
MDWTWITPMVAVLAVALGAIIGSRKRLHRWHRLRRARQTDKGVGTCANCGYSLTGLDIPRCPECGALRGFKKPLTELGLTEDEVREGFARRRRQRESRQDSSESQL